MPTGENSDHISQEPNNLIFLTKIILNSFKIFFSTKKISFSIFIFLSFPLSLLLFLFSFLTFPLQNRIQHLQQLSLFSSIHVESQHLLEEANKVAKSLLFFKISFFFPIFLLSFFTAVAAVNIAFSICSSNGKPSILTIFTAVKVAWVRVLVTTTCVYATMLACTAGPGTALAVFETGPLIRVVVAVLVSGWEIHMMAITSLSLVVSVIEGVYGFDAIWVGSGLMEGKRVCGWVLSGFFVLFSGFIRGEIEVAMMAMAMNGSDFERIESTVVIRLLLDNVVWIILYGLVIQFSYVVTTIFYFDLKKRDSIRSDRDGEISLG